MSLLNPTSCLHDLIPAKRFCDVICKLHGEKHYPEPYTRTKYYKNSTIIYGLNHSFNNNNAIILRIIKLFYMYVHFV